MGVQFKSLVQPTSVTFQQLAGRTIAFDAYNILYQFLTTIRGRDGMSLMDHKGRVTSHLNGLFYRTAKLLESEITPVFVFDGIPPKLKQATVAERVEARATAGEKWRAAMAAGEKEEARRWAGPSARLTDDMIAEAQALLEAMGVAWLKAPSEGEAQAASMAAKGQVYGVVSQDYDSLLFGATRLIRNLTVSGRRKLPGREIYIEVKPEMIELEPALATLGITRQQLVWLAILIGTDYNDGIKGIGPKKALKIVQAHTSLRSILKEVGEIPNAEQIESMFLQPMVADIEIPKFKPSREKTIDFLCTERDFMRDRVERVMDSILKRTGEKTSQARLGEWFRG